MLIEAQNAHPVGHLDQCVQGLGVGAVTCKQKTASNYHSFLQISKKRANSMSLIKNTWFT